MSHGQPGPQRVPEDAFPGFPEEEEEATGSLTDIRRELDSAVDATSARYATLTPQEMQVMGGWQGVPVTIGFRQWRWSSHIAEHSIQIEKTIDMLERPRSEVDWLVRANARAFGQLDATTFGRASADDAAPILDQVAAELDDLRSVLTAAAEAAVPRGLVAPDRCPSGFCPRRSGRCSRSNMGTKPIARHVLLASMFVERQSVTSHS